MPLAKELLTYTEPDEEYARYDMGAPYRDAAKLHRFLLDDLSKAARYIPPEDDTFRGIRPALRTLSTTRCLTVCRELLLETPSEGWGEKTLTQWKQWDVQGENIVLLTLGAMCRTGVMAQSDGLWVRTRFGERVTYEWKWETPLESTRHLWTTGMRREHLNSLSWAWEVLNPFDSRMFLSKLVSDPAGIYHEKLPERKNRNLALQLVAAAAALGAVWFTGWRWEPTVYGLWLAHHPDSPLRAEI
jgi:hypothetical protein